MRDKIRDIVIKIVAGSIDMSKGIDDIEAKTLSKILRMAFLSKQVEPFEITTKIYTLLN